MEFYKTKIRPWIGILALAFIGYIMLTKEAPSSTDVHGRNTILKSIMVAIWGVPAGIVCVLAAVGLGYVQVKGGSGEEKTEEEQM